MDPRIDLSERSLAQWYTAALSEKERRSLIEDTGTAIQFGLSPGWNRLTETAKEKIKARYIEVLTEGYRLQDEIDAKERMPK